jgi:hypothetical protein
LNFVLDGGSQYGLKGRTKMKDIREIFCTERFSESVDKKIPATQELT